MPISRKFDMTMGHYCFPPQKILQGSEDVFVEGKQAHRVGDRIQTHCCDNCHPSFASQGSPTVYVNGKAVMRITDRANCGSVIMTGATTVRAG